MNDRADLPAMPGHRSDGMTQREHMALAIMCAMLGRVQMSYPGAAKDAVAYADALLAELAKEDK